MPLQGREVIPQDGVVDSLGTCFSTPLVEGLMLVKVEKDGGDAGDASTTCTFTYTVKTLGDDTLEEEVTPEQARYENCAYLEAGAGDRSEYAIAAKNEDNDLILLWVPGEIPDTTACA